MNNVTQFFKEVKIEITEISLLHGTSCVGILRQETFLTPGSPGLGLGVNGVPSPTPTPRSSSGSNSGGVVVKPYFNVFSTDSRSTEILNVEGGRQNCFLSILVFLLESLKVAAETSNTTSTTTSFHSATSRMRSGSDGLRDFHDGDLGSNPRRNVLSGPVYVSSVIRDISLEIFQSRDLSSLFDYLSGYGIDCRLPTTR